MDLMEEELPKNFLLEWQHDTMVRLVHVARSVGNKYTRSKVRKAMSPEFAYVMEELMVEHRRADKKRYVEQILETDHHDRKGQTVYCSDGPSDPGSDDRSSACDRRYLR